MKPAPPVTRKFMPQAKATAWNWKLETSGTCWNVVGVQRAGDCGRGLQIESALVRVATGDAPVPSGDSPGGMGITVHAREDDLGSGRAGLFWAARRTFRSTDFFRTNRGLRNENPAGRRIRHASRVRSPVLASAACWVLAARLGGWCGAFHPARRPEVLSRRRAFCR